MLSSMTTKSILKRTSSQLMKTNQRISFESHTKGIERRSRRKCVEEALQVMATSHSHHLLNHKVVNLVTSYELVEAIEQTLVHESDKMSRLSKA